MLANLENSAAVATGLEKVSFHSSPKEGQYQRMFKLPHSCTHFTCQQSNVQNSPSQASTVRKLRTPRCSSWIQKRQRNHRSNCQHPLDHRKSKSSRITSTSVLLTTLPIKTVQINKGQRVTQLLLLPYYQTRKIRATKHLDLVIQPFGCRKLQFQGL